MVKMQFKFSNLFLSILMSSFCLSNSEQTINIHLITTNDIHGAITEDKAYWMNPEYPPDMVGGAGFSKYVDDIREEAINHNEGVLLLDGGNFFQGTPFGMADNGQSMIEWFNRIQYDAVVPARYDFISGVNNLNTLINTANFPFVGANVECNNCPLTSQNFKPYIIKDIKGVKVGILGVVHSEIPELVLNENLRNITLDYEKPTLEKWIPILRKKGAEVIVVLTSAGIPWEREKVYEEFLSDLDTKDVNNTSLNAIEMGYFAQGADLIVTGGNSKGYRSLWYDPFSHVYTMQNYGNSFTHLKLTIDAESHMLLGVETEIDGDVSQSLLADNFQPNFQDLKWIREKQETALETYYHSKNEINSTEVLKNEFSEFQFDNWDFPNLDSEQNIEILTWNCEFFPHANDSTILALAEAVHDFSADIIAFQEIKRTGWFSKLIKLLPEYSFEVSKQSSFMDQAIIFKKNLFTLERIVEPFSESDYNFAGRPPMRTDFIYNDGDNQLPFSVINLHMKCCNSGLSRRQKAVKSLHEYVSDEAEKDGTHFIVLGDWNDDLKDDPTEHCFQPFLDDNAYFFPTWDITFDISQASYPKEPYVSFLDHILVSNSLVEPNSDYFVQTLPMADYMGSFEIYETYISDHLPVMLSFPIK
jgi:endonuclease/exonuclease/phosphatase family metal-dependent hydrolase